MHASRFRGTTGDRRRFAALGATALIVGVILGTNVLSAFASNAPSRPVDRDLSRYVLFAFDTLDFKGGTISGGDVGANGIDTNPGDSNPVLSICANRAVTMEAGSQLVADSMRVTDDCSVWDVFANSTTAGSNVVPQNSGPNSFATPVIAGPPPFPSFSCAGGAPVNVPKNTSANLVAKTYGSVTLEDGSHTTLAPGVYTLCDLHVGRNAQVTTAPGTELRIEQTFTVSNGTSFGPDCSVPVYVGGDGVGANDFTANFAKNTNIAGHFFTLDGKLALGDSTNLSGQFLARDIISDADVTVTGCGGGGATTTTSTSTTTPSSSTSTTTASTTTSSTSTTVPEGSTSTTSTSTTVPETTSSSTTSTTSTTASTSTSTSTTSATSTTTTVRDTTSTTAATSSTTTSSSPSSSTTTLPTTTTTISDTSHRSTTSTEVKSETTELIPLTMTSAPSGVPEEPQSLPRTGGGWSGAPLAFVFIVIGAALIGLGRRRSARQSH